jgi:hypothetical protein
MGKPPSKYIFVAGFGGFAAKTSNKTGCWAAPS